MASLPNIHQVESSDRFRELLSEDLQRVSLLYFWAPWAEPCKQMTEVVDELSRKYPKLLSLKIEAETQSDISESFDIQSVPTFVILQVRCPFSAFSGNCTTQKPLSHRRRVTPYLHASQALMPALSPMPSQSISTRRPPPHHFPIRRSPLHLH